MFFYDIWQVIIELFNVQLLWGFLYYEFEVYKINPRLISQL